jgi:hypothetical protein
VSIKRSDLQDYQRWLTKKEEGRTCSKVVKTFSGEDPYRLSQYAKHSKYIVVINPLGALSGGVDSFKDNLKVSLNHERLHLVFHESPLTRKRIKAEWEALTAEEKERFKKTLIHHSIHDEQDLLKEYLSFSRQENPQDL